LAPSALPNDAVNIKGPFQSHAGDPQRRVNNHVQTIWALAHPARLSILLVLMSTQSHSATACVAEVCVSLPRPAAMAFGNSNGSALSNASSRRTAENATMESVSCRCATSSQLGLFIVTLLSESRYRIPTGGNGCGVSPFGQTSHRFSACDIAVMPAVLARPGKIPRRQVLRLLSLLDASEKSVLRSRL
jgi:hypothetical protein